MVKDMIPWVDYFRYIQSSRWYEVKQRYLKSRLPKQCLVCHAPYQKGFHLHHKTYKRLGHEWLNDLAMLCPAHHQKIHDVYNEKRRKGEAGGGLWGVTKGVVRAANESSRKTKRRALRRAARQRRAARKAQKREANLP